MQFFVNGAPVCGDVLPLGVQGEALTTTVTADVSDWLEQWPDGQVIVQVISPGQTQTRIANTVVQEGVLTWLVTSEDTVTPGFGAGVVKLIQGQQVKKSAPFITQVVGEPNDESSAQETVPGWVDEAIRQMQQLELDTDLSAQAAQAAQTAAEAARDAAQTAQTAAETASGSASGSAQTAQTAAAAAGESADAAQTYKTAAETAAQTAETASGSASGSAQQARTAAAAAGAAAESAQTAQTAAEAAQADAAASAAQAAQSATDAQTAAESAQQAVSGAVKYSEAQTLTVAQQAQARANIGGGSAEDVADLKSALDVTLISWEQGTYGSGRPGSSAKRIRTVGAFKVAYPFTVKAISGYGYNVFYGTTEDTPYQYYSEWQTVDHTYFDPNLYYRITASHNDQSNIYPTETPVNLVVDWDYYQNEMESINNSLIPLCVEDDNYFTWERGTINGQGADENSTKRIRTKGTYGFTTLFQVSCDTGYGYNVFVSNVGGTPLPLYSAWQTGSMVFPVDITKIYRFSFAKLDSSTIVTADSVHFHLKRLDSNLFAQEDNPIMPCGAWFRTYSHSIETTKAPKNTLSACKSAYDLGYRWLESDIHMTSDNVPVMCHNATINATSNYTGDKTIAEMTYDELLEYDFGSWFSSDFAGEKILTLDTLCKFAYTHDCGLSLECKRDYSWTAETILIVYNIVKKNNMLGRVIWNNAGVVTPMNLMKALDPNQDFAFFYENAVPSNFDALIAFKTASNRVEVCDYLSAWTQEKVDDAKAAGLTCLAHHITNGITENLTLAEFKSMIDMGFEATLVQGINTTKWSSEMFE